MKRTSKRGDVISFNERLFERVLKENELLSGRIHHILAIARANQRIQDNFDALEQRILKSRSVREMARVIVQEIRRRFGVDWVTLCVAVDPSDVLSRPDGSGTSALPSFMRIVDPESLARALGGMKRREVILGPPGEGVDLFFTGEMLAEMRSRAIVPLHVSGKLVGTLNLGSRDPQRYSAEQGTDFLRRLGCKISLVMDNILSHQRLLAMSVTDPVTGLANRRQLEGALSRELERARRHKTPLSVMLMDLDGFKEINDRLGHLAGDHALKHVAKKLRDVTRRYDMVARYGGDEFAAMLPHTGAEGAVGVARKFQEALRMSPLEIEGETVTMRLSIGVASFPDTSAHAPEALIREADRRLYRAKELGGDRVIWCELDSGVAQ